MAITITTEMVKALRTRTGAGIMDCRRALEQAGGDLEAAAAILKTRGLAAAATRAGRTASEGLVEAYVHPGNRLGALVEVNCETDFVARTDEFRTLARELAMQVAAAAPRVVAKDDIPAEELAARRAAIARDEPGADDATIERRLGQWIAEVALLEQPYIRDAGRRVGEMITDAIARTGENIQVRRFARFKLGE
ncbi:MAG: elongation factor Ts [Armatimonadota bacterium]|nr:elongation factor Ts [Armatimonadota bacterium]MDR7421315.1 elongation factor Ts [Armatimonadota bacterium]MDR7496917.1 elongation factor Ts [Armatimonadota bacterium]MDR7512582.1 elongation factor Ts [Armatimonadota bacterium]